jgi:type II secretory pathway component GspD/PulD (secretin)
MLFEQSPRRLWIGILMVLGLTLVTFHPLPARAQDQDRELITLQTEETPVVEILQLLAERTGLNIVTGPGVQGKHITIRMRETPFIEALNLVCRASGLGYERVGNSILVAEPNALASPTGLTAQVFDLQYADPVEVEKALKVIADDVKADVKDNRIIVRAPQAALDQAADVVASLDRKPAQVLIEARLVEANYNDLLEAGLDWEKITKWQGVITEGQPDNSAPDALPSELPYFPLGDGERFYRQAEAYELAIDALINDGSARVLSNARVLTVDGEPAEIFAGETVPVVITSLTSPGATGGVLQTVQLEKIDVGVRLNITPRVSDDGFITVKVQPEVSRIVAFVGPDDDLPQTSTRRANAIIRVKEGRKIFIGGLISEEKRQTIKRVPLLGHIPILHYLFEHRRDETVRTDLIIEITPRIIGDEGAETTEEKIQIER